MKPASHARIKLLRPCNNVTGLTDYFVMDKISIEDIVKNVLEGNNLDIGDMNQGNVGISYETLKENLYDNSTNENESNVGIGPYY